MVVIYVVANFGQIITSQLHNHTAYMLASKPALQHNYNHVALKDGAPFSIPVIISPHLPSYNMPPVYS